MRGVYDICYLLHRRLLAHHPLRAVATIARHPPRLDRDRGGAFTHLALRDGAASAARLASSSSGLLRSATGGSRGGDTQPGMACGPGGGCDAACAGCGGLRDSTVNCGLIRAALARSKNIYLKMSRIFKKRQFRNYWSKVWNVGNILKS